MEVKRNPLGYKVTLDSPTTAVPLRDVGVISIIRHMANENFYFIMAKSPGDLIYCLSKLVEWITLYEHFHETGKKDQFFTLCELDPETITIERIISTHTLIHATIKHLLKETQ